MDRVKTEAEKYKGFTRQFNVRLKMFNCERNVKICK